MRPTTLGLAATCLFAFAVVANAGNHDDHSSANFWLPLCGDDVNPICVGFMQAVAEFNVWASANEGKAIFCAPVAALLEIGPQRPKSHDELVY